MDRKKLIKELRDARRYLEDKEWFDRSASPHIDAINNALAMIKMIKEQDEVVHPEPSCEMTYITDCCCDLCGVQLIREDNFCRCCGKRIEWESR